MKSFSPTDRGICGLDRDRMVAALLLRLCLNGVLEALGDLPANDNFRVPAWPGAMAPRAARALENLGGGGLALNEVFQSAARLHRPGDTAEDLVRCCLRLAMLTLVLMDAPEIAWPKEDKIFCRVGYGLLAADNPIIGICGQPSIEFLAGLVSAATASKPGVGLVSSFWPAWSAPLQHPSRVSAWFLSGIGSQWNPAIFP